MSVPPRVSVVMPVHNAEAYVSAATDSVLRQTLDNYEFIIINDGSTDHTGSILQRYRDSRIILFNQRHSGLVASLNCGIEVAKGEYIARMDSDDIAFPTRLEKQVGFLDAHANVGIVGSACWLMDAAERAIELRTLPLGNEEVRWFSLLGNPFMHSSVMMRRDIITKHNLKYDDRFHPVEDYDLWTRMLCYTDGANMQESLMKYREHASGITRQTRAAQLQLHDQIAFRTIRRELPEMAITQEQVSQLRRLFCCGKEPIRAFWKNRLQLAQLYLDMYGRFANRDTARRNLRLRQFVARQVARVMLGKPQPGWIAIFRQLLVLDRDIPWSFPLYVFSAFRRRVRRWMIGAPST